MIVVVMGVTGCGKTIVGRSLALQLGLPFKDADDFHPAANREKLRAGKALDDADRQPWLESLAKHIEEWNKDHGAVLACSALKKSYRDILRGGCPELLLVYLRCDHAITRERLKERAKEGHDLVDEFEDILNGQYRDLEEPERAIAIPCDLPLDDAVSEILSGLPPDHSCEE